MHSDPIDKHPDHGIHNSFLIQVMRDTWHGLGDAGDHRFGAVDEGIGGHAQFAGAGFPVAGWTVAKLLGAHSSKPYNPQIAGAFFRAGEVEAWGRGIQRIFSACKDAGTPEPRIEYEAGDLWFEFPFSESYLTALAAETDHQGGN